ncbi:MAG: IclR family transcriptional regulator [Candidatus Pelethousia sp.]|nr:IclR family transcriptional regulator [Candidatus Pelethousia sp.]
MKQEQIQSINRAISLLECLVHEKRPLSLQELANRTGLAKSTAHRILSTLRDKDWIEQQQTDGRYCLGLRLFEYGCAVSNTWSIAAITKPYMRNIARETGESVCLSQMNKGEVIVLDFLESASTFHVVSRTGLKLPAHCTGQGKVELAYLPPARVRRIIKEQGMQIYTPNTIDNLELLERELATIREKGYAVDNSEFREGLCSVAAPIFDSCGNVNYSVAVVSIYGRIDSEKFLRAKEMVLSAAQDISRTLGYCS